jgi:hypothetical protein
MAGLPSLFELKAIHRLSGDHRAHPTIREFSTDVKMMNSASNPLSISPDGRWVLYTQMDQAGSDLMLVENYR